MSPKYRLPLAIFSNALEAGAIVLLVKCVLPLWGIGIPVWGLVVILAAWAVISVLIYRCGSRALAGLKGVVVKDINPEGTVRIKGELWRARSETLVETGREVEVVSQQGMTLVVRSLDGFI